MCPRTQCRKRLAAGTGALLPADNKGFGIVCSGPKEIVSYLNKICKKMSEPASENRMSRGSLVLSTE